LRTATILKIVFFGHNSAADFPISVKVCAVKQFFHRISAMEQILAFAERIFCFPNAVLASVRGGVFVLSLIHFSSLFSSLRGRQLLNCLALRPPIGPNALPLINQLVIEIS